MKTLSSPADDFGRKKPGGEYTNRAVGNSVPDRANDKRRRVDFYTSQGDLSHSADVRIVGKKYKKPHQGDIDKNFKKSGGSRWEISE